MLPARFQPACSRRWRMGLRRCRFSLSWRASRRRRFCKGMEAGNSRLVLAKSTFERSASNRAIVVAKDLEAAQDELDAAIGGVRHEAAQAIQDEIRPEQDNVSAALARLSHF